MSLLDLSVAELLERSASSDPTPGGGSVAAVSGALGLGLVCMALEITAQRHSASQGHSAASDLAGVLQQVRELLARLKAHPDADVAAFQGYMAALALPRTDDLQKAARKEAMQRAGLAATEAPLAAARDLLAALHLAEQASVLAHRHVVSDVGAGAHLLGAAVQATLLNVDINLSSLPEEARAAALAERQTLAAQAQEKASRIALKVTERLAR